MREKEMEEIFQRVRQGSLLDYQRALKVDSSRAYNSLPFEYQNSYQCILDLYRNHPDISECIPHLMYGNKHVAIWCTILSASCYIKMTADVFHYPASKAISDENKGCPILAAIALHRFSDRLIEYIDPSALERLKRFAKKANTDLKTYCAATYDFFSRFKGPSPAPDEQGEHMRLCLLNVVSDETFKPTVNILPVLGYCEWLLVPKEIAIPFSKCV